MGMMELMHSMLPLSEVGSAGEGSMLGTPPALERDFVSKRCEASEKARSCMLLALYVMLASGQVAVY